MKDDQDKVRSIPAMIIVSKTIQKKYVHYKVRDIKFQTRENILLKVSPMKEVMRLGKMGKQSPRYIGPFEIHECVGTSSI